jgi:hypothetical protein
MAANTLSKGRNTCEFSIELDMGSYKVCPYV